MWENSAVGGDEKAAALINSQKSLYRRLYATARAIEKLKMSGADDGDIRVASLEHEIEELDNDIVEGQALAEEMGLSEILSMELNMQYDTASPAGARETLDQFERNLSDRIPQMPNLRPVPQRAQATPVPQNRPATQHRPYPHTPTSSSHPYQQQQQQQHHRYASPPPRQVETNGYRLTSVDAISWDVYSAMDENISWEDALVTFMMRAVMTAFHVLSSSLLQYSYRRVFAF